MCCSLCCSRSTFRCFSSSCSSPLCCLCSAFCCFSSSRSSPLCCLCSAFCCFSSSCSSPRLLLPFCQYTQAHICRTFFSAMTGCFHMYVSACVKTAVHVHIHACVHSVQVHVCVRASVSVCVPALLSPLLPSPELTSCCLPPGCCCSCVCGSCPSTTISSSFCCCSCSPVASCSFLARLSCRFRFLSSLCFLRSWASEKRSARGRSSSGWGASAVGMAGAMVVVLAGVATV